MYITHFVGSGHAGGLLKTIHPHPLLHPPSTLSKLAPLLAGQVVASPASFKAWR
jgi:hypothetical protein